jgi:hypothetical protein
MKIFAATALALALSATAASGASPSGLRGVVLVDPAYPVCKIGQPCTAPAKHVWLVFSRRGRAVARTRTASDGSYRIALAPGTFAVSSPDHTLGRGLRPQPCLSNVGGSATEPASEPLWLTASLSAAAAPSSAKLPGDDVIDELSSAGPESSPTLAVDNERGESTGREPLLEPRQLSTPRSKETRELVEARIVPNQHHRIDALRKGLEPLEQFPFRGGVEPRLELNRGALAERSPDRFERLASTKGGRAEDESGADFLPLHVLGDPPRRAFASRRERAVEVGEGRFGPARFSVPKQDDRSHAPDRAQTEDRRQAVPLPELCFRLRSPECLDGYAQVAADVGLLLHRPDRRTPTSDCAGRVSKWGACRRFQRRRYRTTDKAKVSRFPQNATAAPHLRAVDGLGGELHEGSTRECAFGRKSFRQGVRPESVRA